MEDSIKEFEDYVTTFIEENNIDKATNDLEHIAQFFSGLSKIPGELFVSTYNIDFDVIKSIDLKMINLCKFSLSRFLFFNII